MKCTAVLILAALLLAGCASTADLERTRALQAAVNPAHPFPESAFEVSQGLTLHYRHWAPRENHDAAPARVPVSGPVGRILLIHGFGASTFSFRFMAPHLAEQGWEVAAVDVPPFGYSDKSAQRLAVPADRGRLLWAVPDALGWEGPIVLLGHSMGGLYAATMAEAFPERTRALVLLAGAVPADGKAPAGAPWFAGLFRGFLESSLRDWSSVKAMLVRFAGKGASIPDDMVDGYAAPFQMPGGVEALFAWSRAGGQAPVHPERLRMPALLVYGEKDTVVPPKTGRALAEVMPDGELALLPGLGHLAHELQPDRVHRTIDAFLLERARPEH